MTDLNNLKEVIKQKADELTDLTIDTLKLGLTLEECFPAIQWTSFEADGKIYQLKLEYTVHEEA